jgi:hypothetical protein
MQWANFGATFVILSRFYQHFHVGQKKNYESEFTRIRSYIDLAPPKFWFLRRCSRNFDPIFDPIIIAKCSQWGFLRPRITVGRIGDGKNVYYKMYLGSITLMKTYPALFAAIGRRDGMDARGAHQMTCAIYRTHQPSGARRSLLLFGTLCSFFHCNIYMYQ